MRQFLNFRGSKVGLLYTFESGRCLSRRYLANRLRASPAFFYLLKYLTCGGQVSSCTPVCTYVSLTNLPRSLEPLHGTMIGLLNNALAPSTRSTYSSGIRSYVSFCAQLGIVAFPVSDSTLCGFFLQGCLTGVFHMLL
jgi:hypothetical protein